MAGGGIGRRGLRFAIGFGGGGVGEGLFVAVSSHGRCIVVIGESTIPDERTLHAMRLAAKGRDSASHGFIENRLSDRQLTLAVHV